MYQRGRAHFFGPPKNARQTESACVLGICLFFHTLKSCASIGRCAFIRRGAFILQISEGCAFIRRGALVFSDLRKMRVNWRVPVYLRVQSEEIR